MMIPDCKSMEKINFDKGKIHFTTSADKSENFIARTVRFFNDRSLNYKYRPTIVNMRHMVARVMFKIKKDLLMK